MPLIDGKYVSLEILRECWWCFLPVEAYTPQIMGPRFCCLCENSRQTIYDPEWEPARDVYSVT